MCIALLSVISVIISLTAVLISVIALLLTLMLLLISVVKLLLSALTLLLLLAAVVPAPAATQLLHPLGRWGRKQPVVSGNTSDVSSINIDVISDNNSNVVTTTNTVTSVTGTGNTVTTGACSTGATSTTSTPVTGGYTTCSTSTACCFGCKITYNLFKNSSLVNNNCTCFISKIGPSLVIILIGASHLTDKFSR